MGGPGALLQRHRSAEPTSTSRWRAGQTLLAFTAVLTFAVYQFSDNKADVDLWGNVGFVSTWPWQEGFRFTNAYSYTEPFRPWVNHEWLGQYVLNRLYVWAGDVGLLGLKVVMGLAVLAMMSAALGQQGTSGPIRFFLLILVVSVMGYGYSTRPHHFTYLLTALFFWGLLKVDQGRTGWLVLFPPLMVFWSNVHGAFFVGLLILAVSAALHPRNRRESSHERERGFFLRGHRGVRAKLALTALLSAAATWLTPYGTDLWRFVAYSATIHRPYLSEWAPLWKAGSIADHLDFLGLGAVTGLAVVLSRDRRRLDHVVWLGGFFVAGVLMRRNIPLFALVAGFLSGPYLERVWGRHLQKILQPFFMSLVVPVFLVGWVGLSAVATVAGRKTNPLRIELRPGEFPVEAVRMLREGQVQGHALVFFDWGEYVIWHLYPQVRVFLDGRLCCAYSKRVIRQYLEFLYGGPAWKEALDCYPTDIVLIHPRNPAYGRMRGQTDWVLVYQNGHSALFLKPSVHADALRRLRKLAPEATQQAGVLWFP